MTLTSGTTINAWSYSNETLRYPYSRLVLLNDLLRIQLKELYEQNKAIALESAE